MEGLAVGLLAATLLISVNGEYCHSWRDPRAQWREGFHCPEPVDRRESVLCCGHCHLRYCCGDNRARLDQGTCRDPSKGQETHSGEHTADLPVSVPFLIVVSVFVVFILVGSVVAMCFCLSQKPLLSPHPSQSPAQGAPASPSQPPETLPMTASTGTSCGSSSSLYPLNSAPQNQTTQQHFTLEKQQRASSPSFPQPLNPAFHRTMTLPTMLHPLMLPTAMIDTYRMNRYGVRPYRSVPSPYQHNSGTGTIQRSGEIIV